MKAQHLADMAWLFDTERDERPHETFLFLFKYIYNEFGHHANQADKEKAFQWCQMLETLLNQAHLDTPAECRARNILSYLVRWGGNDEIAKVDKLVVPNRCRPSDQQKDVDRLKRMMVSSLGLQYKVSRSEANSTCKRRL